MPLSYHTGQIEVQNEANSRPAADMLAERLAGRTPRSISFYESADLLVIATPDASGVLTLQRLLRHRSSAAANRGPGAPAP